MLGGLGSFQRQGSSRPGFVKWPRAHGPAESLMTCQGGAGTRGQQWRSGADSFATHVSAHLRGCVRGSWKSQRKHPRSRALQRQVHIPAAVKQGSHFIAALAALTARVGAGRERPRWQRVLPEIPQSQHCCWAVSPWWPLPPVSWQAAGTPSYPCP